MARTGILQIRLQGKDTIFIIRKEAVMKVEGIKLAKRISDHLYRLDDDIQPEDLLRIIRMVAQKGKEFSTYLGYSSNRIFYTDKDISRQEFDIVMNVKQNSYFDVEYIIGKRYTREELAEKLGTRFRIKRSATKAELLRLAIQKDTCYCLFKELILKEKCDSWDSFCKSKKVIPASKEGLLVFKETEPYKKLLSGKGPLQYWVLSAEYSGTVQFKDYETKRYDNTVFINLDSNDKEILKLINEVLYSAQDSCFRVEPLNRAIETEDIGFQDGTPIEYYTGIEDLASYFGKRHGSRLDTFYLGLCEREDKTIIRELEGKRFLFSIGPVHIGRSCDKELFEKTATHMRIEYIEGESIVTKVVRTRTVELVSALWQLNEARYFYVVMLD